MVIIAYLTGYFQEKNVNSSVPLEKIVTIGCKKKKNISVLYGVSAILAVDSARFVEKIVDKKLLTGHGKNRE